jgi:hypothetical protein
MAAYFATPLSSVTTVPAATATKVPATAQGSRVMLKLFNDDAAASIFYGGSTVSATNGIPVGPGGESEWIPCSGDIWVYSVAGTTVRALEGA